MGLKCVRIFKSLAFEKMVSGTFISLSEISAVNLIGLGGDCLLGQ